MKALITGASGFVGQHLARHLLEQGDSVTGTLFGGDGGLPGVHSIELDVTDSGACLRAISDEQPDVVYHLAGVAFVPDAERNPRQALLVNVLGVDNILRAVKEHCPHCRVVFVSSSEVYGDFEPAELPLREDKVPQPKHQYGLTKRFAELVADKYRRVDGANVIVLRAFNHIGPGQRSDFVVSSFARQLAEIKRGLRPPTLAVGNLEAKRDFTDVRDIVCAYRLAAQRGSGIINLCSGKAVAIRAILDELVSLSGISVSVTVDSALLRPVDIPELRGSNALAYQELGWKPQIPLSKTLRDTYESWLGRVA